MATEAPPAPAAPAAPPSGKVVIPDLGPPPPPPKPTSSIQVSQMPTSLNEPPKPGTARARINEDLAKLAAKKAAAPTPNRPPPAAPEATKLGTQRAPTPAPADAPVAGANENTNPPEGEAPEGAELEAAPQAPAAAPGEKKVSPWKLVDEWKGKHSKLEKEYSDLKGQLVPGEERKALTEKVSTIEKRNKELEDEIRYVNYEKSQEFQDKYEKPFQMAWQTARADLSELTVEDAQGNSRPISDQDLIGLATLGLKDRKVMAEQMFGDFADDVMTHVKEIRRLSLERQEALQRERKAGADRQKEQMEKAQKAHLERENYIRNTWGKLNDQVIHDQKYGEYFRKVEGDQEGNLSLAKGFELVDNAMILDPHNEKLSPEEVASIVTKHAVVRNRAAAFGRLVKWNRSLRSEVDELKKKLDEYKDEEPPASGSLVPTEAPKSGGWAAIREELAKRAK